MKKAKVKKLKSYLIGKGYIIKNIIYASSVVFICFFQNKNHVVKACEMYSDNRKVKELRKEETVLKIVGRRVINFKVKLEESSFFCIDKDFIDGIPFEIAFFREDNMYEAFKAYIENKHKEGIAGFDFLYNKGILKNFVLDNNCRIKCIDFGGTLFNTERGFKKAKDKDFKEIESFRT